MNSLKNQTAVNKKIFDAIESLDKSITSLENRVSQQTARLLELEVTFVRLDHRGI